jgi:hypothetical protein
MFLTEQQGKLMDYFKGINHWKESVIMITLDPK